MTTIIEDYDKFLSEDNSSMREESEELEHSVRISHDYLKPPQFHQFRGLLRRFWLAIVGLILILIIALALNPLSTNMIMTHIILALPSLHWILILTSLIYCVTQLIKTLMIGVISPNSLGFFKWLRTTAFNHSWKSIYKRKVDIDTAYFKTIFTTKRGFLNINGLKCSTAICLNNDETDQWVIYTHGIGEDVSFILNNKNYINELVKLHPEKNIAMISRPHLGVISGWFDYYHDRTPISTVVGLYEHIKEEYNTPTSFIFHGHSMGGAITVEAIKIIKTTNENPKIKMILDRTLTSVPKVVGARSIKLFGWLFKMTGYDYATIPRKPKYWLSSLFWMTVGALILMSCMLLSTFICNQFLSIMYVTYTNPSASQAWIAYFGFVALDVNSSLLTLISQTLAVLPLMIQQSFIPVLSHSKSQSVAWLLMSLMVIGMITFHLPITVSLPVILIYTTIDLIRHSWRTLDNSAIKDISTFVLYNKQDKSVIGEGRLDNSLVNNKNITFSEHITTNATDKAHVASWNDDNITSLYNWMDIK